MTAHVIRPCKFYTAITGNRCYRARAAARSLLQCLQR